MSRFQGLKHPKVTRVVGYKEVASGWLSPPQRQKESLHMGKLFDTLRDATRRGITLGRVTVKVIIKFVFSRAK